jgi:predicted 3-demethylubiquinone-9 3-methyltransferase (glyoxalase superfamily)
MTTKITQKITPFLWFDDKAEEVANFYTSIFKDSQAGRDQSLRRESSKSLWPAKGLCDDGCVELEDRSSSLSMADRCSNSVSRSRLS